jgi:uracil-DNA glycosylase
MTVKKRFHAPMRTLLLRGWHGADVITLGREAFLWFGIGDREACAALEAFWAREDRFEASVPARLVLDDGTQRTLRLHPLPHPSPLNATWYKKFPALLDARLEQLDVRPDRLRVG